MMSFFFTNVLVLLVLCLGISVNGFVPKSVLAPQTFAARRSSTTQLYNFFGEQERDSLTRDSEPEQFFSTNTDKMSDEEKLPIAIAGVAFITIPFIAGLIALYAAK
jgi:hypothetical protein